jgi:hypothetical protein
MAIQSFAIFDKRYTAFHELVASMTNFSRLDPISLHLHP